MSSPDLGARRWWGLGALALSALVLGLDLTILNVALPTLSADLNAGTGELQWIVDSYVLVFAALLLPAGLAGDRFGRRRVLLAGLVVFGAASLAGALAGGPGSMIAARTAMGLGAAIVMPLTMSILPVIFPPHERTRAVAVWSAAMALGLPLGPVLGGLLLDRFWWGSIFLVNVPLVALSLVAVALLLPESRDPAAPRLDLPGALLSVTGLPALVYGIIEVPAAGWSDPLVLASIGAGVALLTGFALWERRTAQPMMDVGLFRDPAFLWPALTATLGTGVVAGVLFVLPLYLQSVQGHDALGTGVRMIPMMLGLLAGGLATDRLVPRAGHRPVVVAGLLVLAAGTGWGAFAAPGSAYAFTAAWLVVTGLGMGLSLVPSMDMAMAALPGDRTGRGSGLVQTLRQTGAAIGVAGLGSLLSSFYRDRLDTGGLPEAAAGTARDSIGGAVAVADRLADGALLSSALDAYVDGMSAVLAACALASLAMAVPARAFLPRRASERASATPDGTESAYEHLTG